MAEKSVEPDASRRNVASSPTSETPAGKASRNVSLGEQPAPTPVISFLFDSMRIANTRKGNAELMEAGKVMKAIQDELDQDEQRTFKEMSDKIDTVLNNIYERRGVWPRFIYVYFLNPRKVYRRACRFRAYAETSSALKQFRKQMGEVAAASATVEHTQSAIPVDPGEVPTPRAATFPLSIRVPSSSAPEAAQSDVSTPRAASTPFTSLSWFAGVKGKTGAPVYKGEALPLSEDNPSLEDLGDDEDSAAEDLQRDYPNFFQRFSSEVQDQSNEVTITSSPTTSLLAEATMVYDEPDVVDD